jgi:hypothetical protein
MATAKVPRSTVINHIDYAARMTRDTGDPPNFITSDRPKLTADPFSSIPRQTVYSSPARGGVSSE